MPTMEDSSCPRLDALLRAAFRRIDPTDARWLLAHAAGRAQSWLFAHGDALADPALVARYEALVAQREAGAPVAYLTGRRAFWTFDLAVSPATLIPRPETECLVESALARLPRAAGTRFADLGTGSGAIALAVARERPDVEVTATDASGDALEVARGNARSLGLARIRFLQGDWFSPLHGECFDVIASNPPYIEAGDPHLERGDLRHEPRAALASGMDGLDALRELAAGAPAHLRPGGWLLVEHGLGQGAAVRALFTAQGLEQAATLTDLEGRDRVTLARRAPPCASGKRAGW